MLYITFHISIIYMYVYTLGSVSLENLKTVFNKYLLTLVYRLLGRHQLSNSI